MLCVEIVGPSYSDVESQIAAASPFADIADVRVDLLKIAKRLCVSALLR
jgi:3-dehydroquinate dehydratase